MSISNGFYKVLRQFLQAQAVGKSFPFRGSSQVLFRSGTFSLRIPAGARGGLQEQNCKSVQPYVGIEIVNDGALDNTCSNIMQDGGEATSCKYRNPSPLNHVPVVNQPMCIPIVYMPHSNSHRLRY